MRSGSAHGFTFVGVLVLVALLGMGLAAIGPLWAQEAQREREEELLRVGRLYAEAIARYRSVSPGSVKLYPSRLEDLLLDTRFVGTVRHLRALYPDPVTRQQPWRLIRATDGGILGVASQSDGIPLRRTPITLGNVTLAAAQRYTDWQFVATPPQ